MDGYEMSPTLGSLSTGQEHRAPRVVEARDSSLDIAVIFTSVDATISALNKAGSLAENLSARITLVVPQIVPYPLPLASPPVSVQFLEMQFREIAAESPVDVVVRLYICRDEMEMLKV